MSNVERSFCSSDVDLSKIGSERKENKHWRWLKKGETAATAESDMPRLDGIDKLRVIKTSYYKTNIKLGINGDQIVKKLAPSGRQAKSRPSSRGSSVPRQKKMTAGMVYKLSAVQEQVEEAAEQARDGALEKII